MLDKVNEKRNLKKLKYQIDHCLENYPETRNSDITLMIQVIQLFYSEILMGDWINIKALYKLPKHDSIKRLRAMVQNKGKWLPTKWEIAQNRHIKEEVWRDYLGFNPELRQV